MSKVLLNAKMPKRRASNRTAPPAGDVTFINVPEPPKSAFNKKRKPGCLIQAQLRHIAHAESARLPREKRDGRAPEEFRTEGDAAAYIASVTRVLHPQARRKRRSLTQAPKSKPVARSVRRKK